MRLRPFVPVVLLSLTACGRAASTAPTGVPPVTVAPVVSALLFVQPPIPIDAVEFVVPIGNLNPPGHTLPTDHAYFYHRLRNPAAPVLTVVAPAAGIIRYVTRGNDDVVGIDATPRQLYYLGHVVLDGGIAPGQAVAAGQRLGTTSTLSFGLDLGVINSDLVLAFANPARYGDNTLHADSPLKYFDPAHRDAVYAKVEGGGSRNDGRIDFDRMGRLSGNWFLDDLAVSESGLLTAGPRQLAFVRDVLDPASVRISIGGTLAMTGVFGIDAAAPAPDDVSPASGAVGYRLFQTFDAEVPRGLLMVELTDDTHLRVEAFPGSTLATTPFTAAARTYVR